MGELAKKRFGHESLYQADTTIRNLKSVEVDNKKKYLEITDLIKMYGEFTALKGISLTINEGEFISFLGPSGCGKTTLLRAIAGLDFQSSGTIIQSDEDISALPPNKRDFGIVFQSYALFPNLSVARNVSYGLENRKADKDEIAKRVSELLQTVGLPGSEHKYPSQLSGGQQQRVALARALATSPGLLLLDEPLSALDAQVRVHLRSEIKDLQHKLGVTTIMVTHDQEEAMTMADRIVVMNAGVIEQVGTPEDIYQRPATAFVASFIGTINLLPCFVSSPYSVDLSGLSLKCDCDTNLLDKKALLAIRPEDIGIRDVSHEDVNCMDVVVDEIEFIGSFARVGLNHGKELSLTAEFSMNVMRDMDIQIGKAIKITLPSDHLRLFPEKQ